MIGTASRRAPRDGLRRWRGLPLAARDVIGVAVLAVPALLPATAPVGIVLGDLPARAPGALDVLLAAAMWFPLAVRRVRPALCLALVGAAFAAHQLLAFPPSAATLALYAAVYSAGAHLRRHRRAVAAAGTAACVAVAAGLVALGSPNGVPILAAGYLVLAACWRTGSWVRSRQREAERRRRLSVRDAVRAEQARIARELHDVVTHHVTAMVVQADAARYVPGAPEPVLSGLATIGDTGRRALEDLRHLLGVLDAGDDPDGAPLSPAAGGIGDLVERTRGAGRAVELEIEGEPRAVPDDRELALHRVAQEALTNALKHAPGAPVRVLLRYGADAVQLEVTNAAPARGTVSAQAIAGGGRGLTGLRRRLELAGGDLSAGPTGDGGFRVRASVPAGDESGEP